MATTTDPAKVTVDHHRPAAPRPHQQHSDQSRIGPVGYGVTGRVTVRALRPAPNPQEMIRPSATAMGRAVGRRHRDPREAPGMLRGSSGDAISSLQMGAITTYIGDDST